MVSKVFHLLKKEFTLELRNPAVLSGIAIYLVSLIFISYLTFSLRGNQISNATWSALFWLTVLFSIINSVAKSFIGEKRGILIYYYTIATAQSIITSKIIYNSILCMVLSYLGFFLFSTFIYNPVDDLPTFLMTLFLTSVGFSASLSFISAIASKTNHASIVTAVLSFPVVLSILLMAVRITKNILDGLERSASYDELLNLLAINCILTTLAYVLFPYIWRS